MIKHEKKNYQEGENVYLPYETKGKFSAIAKEENISGVHNIRSVIELIIIVDRHDHNHHDNDH